MNTQLRRAGLPLACALAVAVLALCQEASAQISFSSGQTISPAYEGFEVNEDGYHACVYCGTDDFRTRVSGHKHFRFRHRVELARGQQRSC